MATNKPNSRKTHITRIFGTNKNGDRLSDIYADIERIDSAESAMQVPPRDQWQAMKRKFRWCDDPDDTDEYDPKGNPSRKTEVLKICDPESTDDINDPEEWIPIRVIKQVKTTSGSGPNQKSQIDNFLNRVINEELRTGREVKVRRVVHYDTNIDDLAQQAADADPTRKEYVVTSDFYSKDLESKDKDQYVEYEIVTRVSHSGNSPPDVNGQARVTKLLNDYLIDESEDATLAIRGNGDINPPYRLDPFQNIINVKFSSDQQWLLGISHTKSPGATTYRAESDLDGDFTNITTGASGSGATVLASDNIAFGSIANGNGIGSRKCFLRNRLTDLLLGELIGGEIAWAVVRSFEFGILSISHANGAFFVSYYSDDQATTRLAFTRDGSNFVTGIDPFPGSPDADTTQGAGRVVYDADLELYLTTGMFEATDDVSIAPSFIAAWSSDGRSWRNFAVDGLYAGIGGSFGTYSTIAVGNGVIVAAASIKHNFSQFSDPDAPQYVLTSCGVAVSSNGVSWTGIGLPGAVVRSSHAEGDRSGGCLAVVFVRDSKVPKIPGKQINGFFVATGIETGGFHGDVDPVTNKMWKSVDGVSWMLLREQNTPFVDSDSYDALSAINKKTTKLIIV